MIGLCGYSFFVSILELAATAQRRQQSVQINERLWNMLSQEQCDQRLSYYSSQSSFGEMTMMSVRSSELEALRRNFGVG